MPKRPETDAPPEDFSDLISREEQPQEERAHGLKLAAGSELDEPRWSVVSFSRREAANLTYKQAVQRITELDNAGISGLCIVTDNAAENVSG